MRVIVLTLFFSVFCKHAIASSDCALLLNDGLRDYYTDYRYFTESLSIRSEVCESKSDNRGIHANLVAKGVPISLDAVNEYKKNYCSLSLTDVHTSSTEITATSLINTRLAELFNECKEISSNGVGIEVKRGQTLVGNALQNADVAIRLFRTGSGSDPIVNSVEHAGFECIAASSKNSRIGSYNRNDATIVFRRFLRKSGKKLKSDNPIDILCTRNADTISRELTLIVRTNSELLSIPFFSREKPLPAYPLTIKGCTSLHNQGPICRTEILHQDGDRFNITNIDGGRDRADCILKDRSTLAASIVRAWTLNEVPAILPAQFDGEKEAFAMINNRGGWWTRCTVVNWPGRDAKSPAN